MIANRRYLALILAALFSMLFAGCAPPGVHRKVRGMVRAAAERELGPADRYEVWTSRDSLGRLKAGRISEVKVHGVNVRPAPGYVLDDIFIHARNVQVNRSQSTVESAESADVTAWISEASLAEMIGHTGVIEAPRVRIAANGVQVSGRYTLAGMPMEVTAEGQIRVASPTSVAFVSDRVTAAGLPVPVPINRAIDFRNIYEPLVVTGATTEPGRVVLVGTVDLSRFGRRSEPPSGR